MKSRNFSVCDFIIDIATEWKLDFWLFLLDPKNSLLEKCPDTEFFLVRIFLHSAWIRRDTPYLSIFSSNAEKYEPEKNPYLDTFHTVEVAGTQLDYWDTVPIFHSFFEKRIIWGNASDGCSHLRFTFICF